LTAGLTEQEEAYLQIWQAFRGFRRVADGRHDTADWRSHPGVFAGCVVRVPAERLQPSLGELQRVLAAFPFARIHPDPFLHIMLQELGFVCQTPERPDEISPARLDEFVDAAAPALGETPPFTVDLGGANSFQDAAFLDVHDEEHAARLHGRLRELAAVPRVPRYAFVPHATVAHYTEEAPVAGLAAAIAPWRDHCFGTFTVSQVEVVTLRVDEPYPPLVPYAVLPLLG
jgi:2'-5' RNA ligase